MKPFLYFMALFCFYGLPILAQQKEIEKVQIFYDEDDLPELFNRIKIGILFIYSDSSKESTRGLLGGKVAWRRVEASTEQGELNGDMLEFDRALVQENGNKATFSIDYNGQHLTGDLHLPYVEKIRFNLYGDSLLRELPFALNVLGIFNTGKKFPLDNNYISFTSSDGKISEDNTLTYSGKSWSDILVWVNLKNDPSIKDSVRIPIKRHIERVENLPSEEEVLKGWESERSRRRPKRPR